MPTQLPKPISSAWKTLPSKDQLAILTSVRFVDFYQLTSVQTCTYWLLQSLDANLPSSTLSVRVGLLQGLFTAGQTISGALWGRLADALGRKPVLLAGLIGMALSCVVAAFATSFTVLALCRLFAGLVNGTTASCKASVADIVPQKQQGRAFATLFLSFNVAAVLGPVISAALFDPGSWHVIPGWMRRYPFAAPSLLSVGAATAMLGGVGLSLQLAIVVSIIRHSPVKAFDATQPLFVLTYALAPYLALVPAASWALWPCIFVGTALHAVTRTYGLLATTMLLDAAVPCQTLRATAHGIAAVVSGLCRTHGAVVGGILHSWGQANNAAGLAWWGCSLLSTIGWALSLCV
ncbi:mfs multidrug transporter [Diplodia corticola]|uniref:Mfs multidrug transporter n=1 Tax=Diplodia corticola TaxID=236234 RepID=A0A1J9QZE9_9PEZI|nr:mfs multidrug transporter [Diplodia corticola]OJD33768.1 mfs multidrug transporter [Diplodia corticola]